jgi:DNA repair protein REV1
MLPGFAYSVMQKIQDKWKISTCGEVRRIADEVTLQKVLGPGTGKKLWNYVRGVDDRELKAEENRKSVSAAINVCSPL